MVVNPIKTNTMRTLFIILFLLANLFSGAQTVCNPNGNLMLYTNYDGGTLTINVDQNIPNLKIGICSYEACYINFTGTFLGNVTEVRYAGYNGSNNTSCGSSIPTTTIVGAPGTATTTIVYAPTATVVNSNGYNTIICGYSCNNTISQGGCNTVDQIEGYFLGYFSGSTLFAHKVQYGCWTGTQSVSVGGNCCPPPPVYPGVVAGSQTICAGSIPSAFTSLNSATVSAGTITYQWQSSTTSSSSGFSNISGANAATYAPAALSQTTYYRRAASTSTSNIAYSNALTLTVSPLPLVSVSGPTAICAGASATLTASGGTSYAWSLGSATGAGASAVITPSVSVVITYTCWPSNGCSVTATYPIIVNPQPNITVASANYSACVGQTITLSVSGGVTHTWMPGNLSGSSVTVSPAASTNYTVISQNQFSCTQTNVIALQVVPLPTLGVANSPTLVCTGNVISLSAWGANVYSWSPGNLVGPTVTITAQSPETYTVFGSDLGCATTQTISLTPLPSPTVTFLSTFQKMCTGEKAKIEAGGATSYTLTSAAATTAFNSTVLISPKITTTYTLIGIAPNSCTGTAVKTITISDCTGIANENSKDEFGIKLYPNPNNGEFLIVSEVAEKIDIIDNSGRTIKKLDLNEENNYKVLVTNLSAGIYFVVPSGERGNFRQKIVVLK